MSYFQNANQNESLLDANEGLALGLVRRYQSETNHSKTPLETEFHFHSSSALSDAWAKYHMTRI